MMKKIQSLLFFVFVAGVLSAQNTVGLISYDLTKAYDGYNLVFPFQQPNVYLLNNCGEVIHVWEDDPAYIAGVTTYLLPNGNLVKAKRLASTTGDAIFAPGAGAIVEMRDWDNQLLWDFEMNNDSMRLHIDIEPMDNGNVLVIAWKKYTVEEAIQAGRDTTFAPLVQGEIWEDVILEINSNGEIVWEWHTWDHLIQDRDATKDNFGVVEDHPRLVDVNYDSNGGKADWMHVNAVDYNEDLDQIMISVPFFNELWIIDHSTTTAEAASHAGGNSGLGGDLMYRWGNPANYGGNAADQKLFFQHNTHWISDFLPTTHPHYGKIAVFNNRVGDDFSTANVINQPWDMYAGEYTLDTDFWGPADFDETITHPTPQKMYSNIMSSVQFLPNGNRLLCTGRWGYSYELTSDDEIVWEYITPLVGATPATQGDTLQINQNLTFEIKRYPTDYTAFTGRDLTPQGYLELEPNTEFCEILATQQPSKYQLKVYPNPANDLLIIEWEKGGKEVAFQIYDIMGRKMEDMTATGGRKYLDISHWEKGMYVVVINGEEVQRVVKSN